MGRIGLTLNEAKTRIVDGHEESFDFLGYTYGPERSRKDGHWYLSAKPSKKSVKRVKEAVRKVLRPGNQQPWSEVVSRLNRILRGWANYFSHGTRLMGYRAVDQYVVQACATFSGDDTRCDISAASSSFRSSGSTRSLGSDRSVDCVCEYPREPSRGIRSESRMREIRTSGSMSGKRKRSHGAD